MRLRLVVARPLLAMRRGTSTREAARQELGRLVHEERNLKEAVAFFRRREAHDEKNGKDAFLRDSDLAVVVREGTGDELLLLDRLARQCRVESAALVPDARLRGAFGEIVRHWGKPSWSREGPRWRKQVLVAVENGAVAPSKEIYSEVRFFLGRFWFEDRNKPDGARYLEAARLWVRRNDMWKFSRRENFVRRFILTREEIVPTIDELFKHKELVRGALDLVVDHVLFPVDSQLFLDEVVPRLGLVDAQQRLVGLMLLAKMSHLLRLPTEVEDSVQLARCVLENIEHDGGRFLTLSNVKNMRQLAFLLSVDAVDEEDISMQLSALDELAKLTWDRKILAHNDHFLRMRIQRKLFLLERYDEVVTRFSMSPVKVWTEMLFFKGDLKALTSFATRHDFAIPPSPHFARLCRSSEDLDLKIRGQILMGQDERLRKLDLSVYDELLQAASLSSS